MRSIFMASTPLHILNSIAIAGKQDGEHHLLIIDQPDIHKNPYFQLLQEWPTSPFQSVHIYPGRVRKVRAKLALRKQLFHSLEHHCQEIKPTHIYIGNDRRIEFQYSMHICKTMGLATTGIYMDEGTFTYVGRAASASFSDRVIDNLIKKITYGRWWDNPPTVGGSGWIQDVYAAFPQWVVPALQQKRLHNLQDCYHHNGFIDDFSTRFLQLYAFDAKRLAGIDVLITTPHESLINRIPDYKSTLKGVIQSLISSGKNVAIKYHPRNLDPDALGVVEMAGVVQIPSAIPFEMLCPLMQGITLVGDLSSTLINASWMTSGIRIIALKVTGPSEFDALFEKLAVPMIAPADLPEELAKA